MARCSTRGPCAAVSRGRQAAQRASAWMPMPFRQGRMPCRKARPRLTDLPGRSPASAKRGVVFSWLLLFWTSKREVTRPPKEGESSSLWMQQQTRALPASGLLQGGREVERLPKAGGSSCSESSTRRELEQARASRLKSLPHKGSARFDGDAHRDDGYPASARHRDPSRWHHPPPCRQVPHRRPDLRRDFSYP
jgi:hypothetical protein